MRRILYIDHTARMSGGEIALLHLVQHLDRSRYEPVVVLSSDGPLWEKLKASGVEAHLLLAEPSVLETRKDSLGLSTLLRVRDLGRAVRHVLVLQRFIRTNRISLVHTNSLKSDIMGGAAARLARTPLLWHVRDRIDADYLPPPVAWLFRRLCRWVPDYVIANSQATLETLALTAKERSAAVYSGIDVASRMRVVHDGVRGVESIGRPAAKARVTYSGVHAVSRDPDGMAPAPDGTDPAPFSAEEGVGARKIGLVGRIARWKGQHVFLRSAALVRQRFPEARFQIIGAALFDEHAYTGEIQELVWTLGLEDCVEFLGFRDDVPDVVAGLDVLVHASITAEPFGQVIVEGMAAARPIVATDGGGAKEIVVNGETGLLVPMGDVDAMAEAIVFLLDNREVAREMGVRGYQRACELFSIERTARSMEAIYDEMLS